MTRNECFLESGGQVGIGFRTTVMRSFIEGPNSTFDRLILKIPARKTTDLDRVVDVGGGVSMIRVPSVVPRISGRTVPRARRVAAGGVNLFIATGATRVHDDLPSNELECALLPILK